MNPMAAKNTYLSKSSHCNRAIISEAFMLQFITCKCSELCKHFSEDWRFPLQRWWKADVMSSLLKFNIK